MIETPVEIKTPDGVAGGFLYQPAPRGKWPGVIHLTDIFGVRPAQQRMAGQLCEAGYVVLMPNIFYRTGLPPIFDRPYDPKDEYIIKRIGELRASLPPDAMTRDASAYVDFLAQQPAVAGAKFGAVGYCFAGAMALRITAAFPEKIGAAASFHGGGLFTGAPDSPHTVLPRVKARLYFGHAVDDRSMSAEAIAKFEAALAAWGGKYESETYSGCLHGWTTLDSAVYNPEGAARAFSKLTALFSAALS
ncbi:MAG TPA: dienelactone hydrolase family protein [Verrucomicrobiae bacterium]|nr:dienelactone hydrolase family protein [Verrucomicrobiae bacterium]